MVNTGVRGALDEFVMLWVEEDINRQLGPNLEAISSALPYVAPRQWVDDITFRCFGPRGAH